MNSLKQVQAPATSAQDDNSFAIVGVGASAGGLPALVTLLEHMPATPGIALVVILHLSQEHPSAAHKLLQRVTEMPVVQVTHHMHIRPDHVYVIAPGRSLGIENGRLLVDELTRPLGIPITINIFLQALAAAHRERAIGVILSGMGSDGAAGLASIKQHGGLTIAQLPAEAEESSMPQAAIGSGVVDFVLPAAQIPARLLELRDLIKARQYQPSEPGPAPSADAPQDDVLDSILDLLHLRTGHDFRQYKRPTLLRRLDRRLQVRACPDLAAYLPLLLHDLDEAAALLQDLLIGVTGFFRDRDAFHALAEHILPQLFQNKGPGDQLRAWVAACSTGEEAYSLGMLLADHAKASTSAPTMRIFASDIDERAIAVARARHFPLSIAADIPPQQLERYFSHEETHYKVRKVLRDEIVFATHNLLRDPAFSRIDLISCRNFLIYLNRDMHDQVLELFHSALNPGGYLFLGSAESADLTPDLFERAHERYPIYRARVRDGAVRRLSIMDGAGAGAAHALPAQAAASAGELYPHAALRQRGPIPPGDEVPPPHGADDALRSTIERLHARIESLESSTEELQSRNEELHTVNTELQMTAQETAKANDDLSNLIASTDIATLFLDAQLRIQRYTPHATRIFRLIPGDVGRPLSHLTNMLDYPGLHADVASVLRTAQASEHEVRSTDGHDYIVRLHPYRTAYEQVEGVVLTFFDITRRRAAEQALHESEKLFRSFVTASSNMLYKMSADWSEMRTLQGKNILADFDNPSRSWLEQYIPEEARPEVLAAIERAIRDKSIFELEHRVLRADGSTAWTLSRAVPLFDEAGNIVEWLGAGSDITERKHAEVALREGEARLRALAEAPPALIWQLDSQGNAVYLNQRYLDVTGTSMDQMLATGWHAVVHADDAPRYLAAVQDALSGQRPLQQRVRQRMADGDWHWFESYAQPWYAVDHQYRGLVGISIDVNEAVQAEQALKAADRRKDEFLATLAHELRNPLAPISNAVQFLRHPSGKRKADRLLEMVERQVRQMVRLLDDLMEVTRVTRGKIDLRRAPIVLADVLKQALETSQPCFQAREQQVKVELPETSLMLDADQVRLTQVFANLLNNASKYTSAGGTICLSARREQDCAVIAVRDTGMGIEPDQLPLVFEMFSQPHGRHGHSESGLGIGLAMVRSLVALHGGSVSAHSEGPGKGSQFVVRLPLLAPDSQTAADGASADDELIGLAGQRVLVVDDNRDAADSLCQVLAVRGADARAVYDGPAALAALETEGADTVLLDIGMPDMDGYQVAQQIRGSGSDIQIIALSGWGQRADRMRSQASGFDHHLTKPADIGMLLRLLAQGRASPAQSASR